MFMLSKNAVPFPGHFYPGSANPMLMVGSYFTQFSCYFALEMYPFDRQVCELYFKVKDVTNEYIQLVKNHTNAITFTGETCQWFYLKNNYFINSKILKA